MIGDRHGRLLVHTARPEVLALASGALLGLSAPGFNQWYLAWCGLVPFFLLIDSSRSSWNAVLRGWLFGFGYNLLWLSFFLKLNPPLWIGIESPLQLSIIAVACWLIASAIYGALYALIGLTTRWLFLSGWLMAAPGRPLTGMPAAAALPLLWLIAFSVLGNQPDLLLMPMSSLEYSQYKNISLIQVCSIIGGVGLQFIMVVHNLTLAVVVASLRRRTGVSALSSQGIRPAIVQWLVSVCLITGIAIWGGYSLRSSLVQADENVSVLQSGLMMETERRRRGLNASEVLALCIPMLERCPPGLVVWTETSLPMLFDARSSLIAALQDLARERRLDIIFGVGEVSQAPDKIYNAAAGIASTGQPAATIYRKRYLIPFGEFEPLVLRSIPDWAKRLIRLPRVPHYLAGNEATVLRLSGGMVAPLICGENVDPALCAASVANGGQVIANISNLFWFQDSTLADLSIATAVFRAVENRRYYVYAADTGPSALVDPEGRLVAQAGWGKVGVVTSKFRYLSQRTWFSRLWPW